MAGFLEFSKLQGAGNDFIFIEDLENHIDINSDIVTALCDRHFGIGADGIIVVKPAVNPENAAFMHYINSDGTIAQMCGNGIRCFAKYLVDHGIVDNQASSINVETRAGVKAITFTTDAYGKLETATVDMGEPILNPSIVPTTLAANARTDSGEAYVRDSGIDSPFGRFSFTCVSMGNPHAVSFIDDIEEVDVEVVGAYFESCSAFPERSNIEFACVRDDGIHMRVYERGCGETLACGTGACATNVAAYLTGRAGCENDLHLRGGTLHISYQPNGTVMMSGPAAESFAGVIAI